MLREVVARGLLEQLLFVGEIEVHGGASLRAAILDRVPPARGTGLPGTGPGLRNRGRIEWDHRVGRAIDHSPLAATSPESPN